jgi:hypothetical protein
MTSLCGVETCYRSSRNLKWSWRSYSRTPPRRMDMVRCTCMKRCTAYREAGKVGRSQQYRQMPSEVLYVEPTRAISLEMK